MPIDAVCVYYNYVGVAHFALAHKNLRITWRHGMACVRTCMWDVTLTWPRPRPRTPRSFLSRALKKIGEIGDEANLK